MLSNKQYAHRQRASDKRNYCRMIIEISAYRPMESLHWNSMRGIIIENIILGNAIVVNTVTYLPWQRLIVKNITYMTLMPILFIYVGC